MTACSINVSEGALVPAGYRRRHQCERFACFEAKRVTEPEFPSMIKSEQSECRRRAWGLAFAVWSVGGFLIIYAHRSLPGSTWGASLTYVMYFLEFWYFLALGELHRCFYVLLTRSRG
jgi:hypothetical protein